MMYYRRSTDLIPKIDVNPEINRSVSMKAGLVIPPVNFRLESLGR